MKIKIKKIQTLLAIASLALGFMACRSGINLDDENQNEDSAKISFDFDIDKAFPDELIEKKNVEGSRTILPENFSLSDDEISKIKLTGTLTGGTGAEASYSKSWNSYASFKAAELEFKKGEWNFLLEIYKKENNVDKLFASASKTVTLSNTERTVVDFELSLDVNELQYGKLDVTVNVPKNELNHAEISLGYYSSGFQNLSLSKSSYTTTENGISATFHITEENIPAGYYYLFIKMFTDDSSTPTATKMDYVYIFGGLKSKKILTYTSINTKFLCRLNLCSLQYETTITTTFSPSEFALDSDGFFSREYTPYEKIILPPASEIYGNFSDFLGWYDNPEYQGAPVTTVNPGDYTGELNFYAKWKYKSFDLDGSNFNIMDYLNKTYSGNASGLYGNYTYRDDLPVPTNVSLSDLNGDDYQNELFFEGWYTDENCGSDSKVDKFDSSVFYDTNGDSIPDSVKTLYARWKYKYVFWDPMNGNDSGNTGSEAVVPLKTLSEVKKYLVNNDNAEKVYLMSPISIGSAASHSEVPSELTTAAYNNTILQRYPGNSDEMLIVSNNEAVSLKEVTIDGGAKWNNNASNGGNAGCSANKPLIVIGPQTSSKLTLDENVILQNNNNSAAGSNGGAIECYGELHIESDSVVIRANRTVENGAAIFLGSNGSVEIKGGIVGGETVSDCNYSKQNGGGIYCSADSTVILDSATVKNNKCSDSGIGAGIYVAGTLKLLNKLLLNSNVVDQTIYILDPNEKKSDLFVVVDGTSEKVITNGKLEKNAEDSETFVSIPGDKYPSSASDFVPLLKDESASATVRLDNTEKNSKYFKMNVSIYGINKLGEIYNSAKNSSGEHPSAGGSEESGGGNIGGQVYESLTGTLSANSISPISVTSLYYVVKNGALDVSEFITNFTVTIYNGLEVVPSTYYSVETNTPKISINSGIPLGTKLRIKTSYSYNNVSGYGDEFEVTVSE